MHQHARQYLSLAVLLLGCGESNENGSNADSDTGSQTTSGGDTSTSGVTGSPTSPVTSTTGSTTTTATAGAGGSSAAATTDSTTGAGGSAGGGGGGELVEAKHLALTDAYGGCVINPQDNLTCWGWVEDAAPMADVFTSLSSFPDDDVICALDSMSIPKCWSSITSVDTEPSTVLQVTVGRNYACSLGQDQLASCWLTAVTDPQAVHEPPSTPFTRIAAGHFHACGVQLDATLLCWGEETLERLSAPGGQYLSAAAGIAHTCAIAMSGEVFCWGGPPGTGREEPPPGGFVDLSVADEYSCGIMSDGSISCWGVAPEGAPSGQFRQIAAANGYACAVASDGALTCWGELGPMTTPPEGIVVK